MAKSRETFGKRDKELRKQKQKQEKKDKMEERKLGAQKGKDLSEMMAYIDENGNISDTPPNPNARKEFNADEIEIGIPQGNERDRSSIGIVLFFNEEKGFGFIAEKQTGKKVFVHSTGLLEPVTVNDKVKFETEMGKNGMMAVSVRKV